MGLDLASKNVGLALILVSTAICLAWLSALTSTTNGLGLGPGLGHELAGFEPTLG